MKTIRNNTYHNVFIQSTSVKELAQLVKYALENLNNESRRVRQASYVESKPNNKNSRGLDRFRFSEKSSEREHMKLQQADNAYQPPRKQKEQSGFTFGKVFKALNSSEVNNLKLPLIKSPGLPFRREKNTENSLVSNSD